MNPVLLHNFQVGKFIQLTSTFFGGFVIAFSQGWLLSLVLLSSIPLLVISAAFMTVVMAKLMSRGQAAYSVGAAIVEQTISSIRTVCINSKSHLPLPSHYV